MDVVVHTFIEELSTKVYVYMVHMHGGGESSFSIYLIFNGKSMRRRRCGVKGVKRSPFHHRLCALCGVDKAGWLLNGSDIAVVMTFI